MVTLGSFAKRTGRMAGGRQRKPWVKLGLMLLLASPLLLELQSFRHPLQLEEPSPRYYTPGDGPAEIHFARLVYGGNMGGWGWGRRGGWATDYPEAEYHFMQGVRRLTNLDVSGGSRLVRPLDEELFECPWLYAVEVGCWHLDTEEAERIREHLLRGGFLVVDDFHGTYQWASFLESMQRVFPERPILDLQEDDPILHVLYDLDQRIQIPGRQHIWSGATYKRDGYDPIGGASMTTRTA